MRRTVLACGLIAVLTLLTDSGTSSGAFLPSAHKLTHPLLDFLTGVPTTVTVSEYSGEDPWQGEDLIACPGQAAKRFADATPEEQARALSGVRRSDICQFIEEEPSGFGYRATADDHHIHANFHKPYGEAPDGTLDVIDKEPTRLEIGLDFARNDRYYQSDRWAGLGTNGELLTWRDAIYYSQDHETGVFESAGCMTRPTPFGEPAGECRGTRTQFRLAAPSPNSFLPLKATLDCSAEDGICRLSVHASANIAGQRVFADVVLKLTAPEIDVLTAPHRLDVSVDLGSPTGERLNADLVGSGWRPGAGPHLSALGARFTRLDAQMERLYPNPPLASQQLGEAPLDEAVAAEIDAALDQTSGSGVAPIIILDYMPSWLAARPDPAGDNTRQPPKDADAWRRLVARTATRFGAERSQRGAAPALYWEVWNEPDLPLFYRGTLPEFLQRIFAPAARGIADAETASGLDLRFGGCGCAFPDPVWMLPMFGLAQAEGLPLDFVSWHYYGNYPFLGPDGPEPLWPEFIPHTAPGFPVYHVLAHRNPLASPVAYRHQVDLVRSWAEAAFAGQRPVPALIIDEWNLSAGGFDQRMDTHEGAAFVAASLVEMQQAGLDAGVLFTSVDPYWDNAVANPSGAEYFGSWGLVTQPGTRKPSWWATRLFADLAPELVAATGTSAADGAWVLAGRQPGPDGALERASVLIVSWLAENSHPHEITLSTQGLPSGSWVATVRRLDSAHAEASAPVEMGPFRGTLRMELPVQSVALVEIVRQELP